MPCTILLLHGSDDLCHVLELLLVLHFSPFVRSVRKEFLIVLCRIVIDVEKVLKVVEAYDMALTALFLGIGTCDAEHQRRKYN